MADTNKQNPIKSIENKIENEVKKDVIVIGRELRTPRARKIEKTIIIVAYVLVALIALYFILVTFFPDLIPRANTYTISAKDSKIFSTLSSFYIDDNSVLGDKTKINQETIRPITSAKKFNLIFAPKINIPNGTIAALELNLLFNDSKTTNIYLDNNIIFPNLDNYELIKETSTDYIYIKKDVSAYNKDSLVQSEDTTKFLLDNFAGASIWALNPINPDIQIPDYKQQDTVISGTFRDNLNLAVYAEGTLKIDFIKQDLNMYPGQDEYTITIKDFNNNIIYNQIYEDDMDRLNSNKIGQEQKFNISLSVPNGIYYISFLKDKYNDASDSTIKNIKINSNKVLILGTFLPITTFNFYISANFPKQIGFYYWHTGKDQIITENQKNINLSKDWISKKYTENLTAGDYNFKLEKGDLWIYSDYVSPKKDNWFSIIQSDKKFNSQAILIISKDNYNTENNEFNYISNITLSEKITKINLRALDSNIANLKNIKLTL